MELIRDGIDQCRAALSRLWDRKKFRAAAIHLSSLERKRLKREVFENFDLQLDAMQDKVELVLRGIREVLYDSSFDVDEHIRYTSDDMYSKKDDVGDDDFYRNLSSGQKKHSRVRSGPHPHAKIRTTNTLPSLSKKLRKTPNFDRGSRSAKRVFYGSKKVNAIKSSSEKVSCTSELSARKHRRFSAAEVKKHKRKELRNYEGSDLSIQPKRKQRRSNQFRCSRNAQSYETNDAGQNIHTCEEVDTNKHQLHMHVSVDKDTSLPMSTPSDNSLLFVRENEVEGDFVFLSEDSLFIDLVDEDKNFHLETVSRIPERGTYTIPALKMCEMLALCYVDDKTKASELLKEIPISFIKEKGDKRKSILGIFRIILSLLQKYGAKSLQEMIQTMEEEYVIVHMNLLICIAKLLKLNAHSYLFDDDGLMYQLFTTRGPKCILELLVLQMIDVLYSHLLPDCWGKPKLMSRTIYKSFLSLRDTIANVTHLTELVSFSLSARFGCQQWRKAIPSHGQNNYNENEKWFVSALDSDGLSKLFENDAKTNNAKGMYILK